MTEEDRQALYDYWNSIPTHKFIDAPESVYKSQPIRRAIVKILREGILDEPEDPRSRKRHVLNAAEIRQLLKERNTINISQTNLYFHLNVLEEAGIIQVPFILKEGPHKRNNTKYYGRVARYLLITDKESSYETYERYFFEFEKLATLLGILLPGDFQDLPKKYLEVENKRHNILASWLVSHETLFTENKINSSDIFEFLKFIDRTDPDYLAVLKETSEKIQGLLDLFTQKK
ncbi:MAG: winged helix-turn-helix domain-containing protein [Candidatus Odinarchaeota archaeon]